MILKKCEGCGGNFKVFPYRINTARFCSILCRNSNPDLSESLRKRNLENNPMKNPEIAKKVGLALKGHEGYWKGKKRDKKTKKAMKKTQFKKGNVPWNKGGEHTKETKEKISENTKKAMDKEVRKKISKSLKKYLQTNPHILEKIKIRQKKIWNTPKYKEIARIRRAKQIFPKKDTKIEVKIQNFLKELGIDFFTHQYMKIPHSYRCDVLIPSMNMVIECDGDYWHKYPVGLEKDHIRTSELIEKGFKVLRLWGSEIKEMDLDKFKVRLKNGN